VGGGLFVGWNSNHHGGGREVRPRRQEDSVRRSRAGVGCGQSSEVKSEMSDKKKAPAADYVDLWGSIGLARHNVE
jgi:hypothetical protein